MRLNLLITLRSEEIEKAAPRPTYLTEIDITRMAEDVIMKFLMIDDYTEANEQNKENISENGSPQLMDLYNQLISEQISL